MNLISALCLFLPVLLSPAKSDPSTCDENLLIGTWQVTKTLHSGVHTNFDSLIELAKGDTVSASYGFKEDGTYVLKSAVEEKDGHGFYTFDKEKCELVKAGKKKDLSRPKFKEYHNWEILHISDKALIFKEDNNPKAFITHVLLRTLAN
ncbi:hypothetical protein GYB22_04685 [bacterium]|nr:hypothetical protein [bacterium]